MEFDFTYTGAAYKGFTAEYGENGKQCLSGQWYMEDRAEEKPQGGARGLLMLLMRNK